MVNGIEEGDDDGDNDDESSIDDEVLKFSEKHEFEVRFLQYLSRL